MKRLLGILGGVVVVGLGWLLFADRGHPVDDCANTGPYAFPPGGQVASDPLLFAYRVVGVTDAAGNALAFAIDAGSVRITAPVGTTFKVDVSGDGMSNPRSFGPYEVVATPLTDVAPVAVARVERFSSGGPSWAQAVVLTVPQSADAYQVELTELPGGKLHTLILPSRPEQLWADAPALPAHLMIGRLNCLWNFHWESPRVQLRVAALRTDGKRSAFTAPIIVRSPLPGDASFLEQAWDVLVENLTRAGVGVALFVAAWIAVTRRAKRSLGSPQ